MSMQKSIIMPTVSILCILLCSSASISAKSFGELWEDAKREGGVVVKNTGDTLEKAGKDTVNEIGRAAGRAGITGPKINDLDPTNIFKSVVPVCWFSSDCWAKSTNKQTAFPVRPSLVDPFPYFALLRTYCMESDTRRDAGFVDISFISKISIQHAEQEVLRIFYSRDKCRERSNTQVANKVPTWHHQRLFGSTANYYELSSKGSRLD